MQFYQWLGRLDNTLITAHMKWRVQMKYNIVFTITWLVTLTVIPFGLILEFLIETFQRRERMKIKLAELGRTTMYDDSTICYSVSLDWIQSNPIICGIAIDLKAPGRWYLCLATIMFMYLIVIINLRVMSFNLTPFFPFSMMTMKKITVYWPWGSSTFPT